MLLVKLVQWFIFEFLVLRYIICHLVKKAHGQNRQKIPFKNSLIK